MENTKLVYGSNVLLSAKGTSEWGNNGSNGGNVTLNADNFAKSISLKLDNSSKITLTGDSYVTSLDDSDSSYSNINLNGYKLYVNGIAI